MARTNRRPSFPIRVAHPLAVSSHSRYPAYLDDKAGGVSPELKLAAAIPTTLIVHNEDDKTHVVGSKIYDAALTAAKVPHEFALYPTGGHGYGLHCERDAKPWPDDALKWLQKVLPRLGK